MSFNHKEIDQKWQSEWEKTQCFKAVIDPKKKKFYALDMFPYPSGAGLHVGHLASYTPTDIVSRYKRAKGFNVLHPIGYDAFGLPAEQYAIQTGVHPLKTTQKAIQNFKRQLKSFGFSFDWSREVSTCEPDYYKWTQKLFTHFFKKNLAYKKKTSVNWCPQLRTTLANEEVIDGKSERGGHAVIQKKIEQWILKITEYAPALLKDLDEIHWPERTKEGQKNWIGKSFGLCMDFPIQHSKEKIPIFTTRPDTLFGATFVVLPPEHPLIEKEFSKNKEFPSIVEYQKQIRSESERKKHSEAEGCFSGSYAIHPLTKKPLPIWIADYVLLDYGTGAIMAVPAHDERDFAFAKKQNLPIKAVIEPFAKDSSSAQNKNAPQLPFTGDGRHFDSDRINDMNNEQAIQTIIKYLEKKKLGFQKIQYKLRDWIFSRQRYWGEPFPLVYFKNSIEPVPDDELPVLLPETADYAPSEKGEPPLARAPSFVNYTHKDGRKGRREVDTMPGSAASSWYFLRYTDPHNNKEPFSFSAQKYWMPVDLYIGGPEHTVGHLLYARFWQKVLYSLGLVSHKEPFKKLVHQGSILGSDGQRMSKSRGNTINPDDVRKKYGADAIRLYISFLGPLDKDKPWSDQGIEGCNRFLNRLWRLCISDQNKCLVEQVEPPQKLKKLLHQTIKKVGDDIEKLSFNTAISAMMILVNELYACKSKNHMIIQTLCRLIQPFAPHIAEELWQRIGEKGLVGLAPWPDFDPGLIQEETVHLAVQINGKMRGALQISPSAEEKEALEKAKQLDNVARFLKSAEIKKVIYRPGKILNIVC